MPSPYGLPTENFLSGYSPLNILREFYPGISSREPSPMTPEEQQSLLSWIGSGMMSGLQYAGESLEKPGVAITGLLSGEPSALLNLIPFSDTLGITDTKDRIYARDMFNRWGIAPPNQPGFGSVEDALWDIGGFALDMALMPNPVSFLSPTAKGIKGLAEARQAFSTGVEPLMAALAKKAPAAGEIAAAAAEPGVKAAMALPAEGAVSRFSAKAPLAKIQEVGTGDRALMNLYSPMPWPLNKVAGALGASDVATGKIPLASFGTGPGIASGLEDLALNKYTAPFVRLFASTAANAADVAAQKEAMKSAEAYHQTLGHIHDILPIYGQVMDHMKGKYAEIANWHKEAGDPHAFEVFTKLLLEAPKGTTWGGKLSPTYMENLLQRMTAEAQWNPTVNRTFPTALATALTPPPVNAATAQKIGEFSREFYGIMDDMIGNMNAGYEQCLNLGMSGKFLEDTFVPHAARGTSLVAGLSKETPDRTRLLSTSFTGAMRRDFALRDVPEGTNTVNRVARDYRLTATKAALKDPDVEGVLKTSLADDLVSIGVTPAPGASLLELQTDYVRHVLLRPAALRAGWKDGDEAMIRLMKGEPLIPKVDEITGKAIPGEYKIAPDTWKKLEETFGVEVHDIAKGATAPKFDPAGNMIEPARAASKAEQLARYFRRAGPEVLEAGLFNRESLLDWANYMEHMAKAQSNLFTMRNFIKGVAQIEQDDGMVPLSQVWKDTDMTPKGRQTLAVEIAGKLGLPHATQKDVDELARTILVPEQTGKVMGAYFDTMKPKVQGQVGQAFDKLLSFWKGWVTSTPSFHTRNLVSGQFQALMRGQWDGKTFIDTVKYMAGKGELPYADEITTFRSLLSQGNRIVDTFGEVTHLGEEGVKAKPFRDLFAAMKEKRWSDVGTAFNPFAMRGGFVGKGENIVSQLGGNAYDTVEFMNRVPQYIACRKMGMSPGEALHQVKLAQFDYTELTKFEKDAMRKLIPFYGWTRKNVPYQMAELLTHPGGRTATATKALHYLQGGGGEEGESYTPSWLKETSTIRLPGGTPEATSFIRGLGLPIEDLRNFIFTKAGPLSAIPSGRTLERFASMLRPGLTAPIQYFSEKSLFTGRPIKHLKPVPIVGTGVPFIDQALLRGGPAGPLISRMENFGEESPLAALTELMFGVKMGSYDLPKWKLIEQKQALENMLAKNPEVQQYRQFFVPKDERAAADPKTLGNLAVMKRLNEAISADAAAEDGAGTVVGELHAREHQEDRWPFPHRLAKRERREEPRRHKR